jgi:hypothetical protein
MNPFVSTALISLCVIIQSQSASAWGGTGHRIIGTLAARNFPAQVPEFLRTPEAIFQLGELAREPDRSRGSGQPHDNDRDPAHFVDVSDDGTILGGPSLSALPRNRQDFDTALRAVKTTQYQAGWLPYSIIDGWQQLVKDFAMWRADVAGEKFATDPQDKSWFAADRKLREMITIRDLGVWSHFVGDGSQPLHATVHFNNWGDFPNPEGFTPAPNFHARFETGFVNANIADKDVAPLMKPLALCNCSIITQTQDYLTTTHTYVLDAFRLDKAHAFDQGTPEAKSFVATRLAEGAAILRDMVAEAWAASDDAQLGYQPLVPLKDIEAGKINPRALLSE